MAVHGYFKVSRADYRARVLVRFDGSSPILADLTGVALKTLGGDGSISTELPAKMPRRWARAVHGHPQKVDGIQYMSRHLNNRIAIALFDRCASMLAATSYVPLPSLPGIGATLKVLHIRLQRP